MVKSNYKQGDLLRVAYSALVNNYSVDNVAIIYIDSINPDNTISFFKLKDITRVKNTIYNAKLEKATVANITFSTIEKLGSVRKGALVKGDPIRIYYSNSSYINALFDKYISNKNTVRILIPMSHRRYKRLTVNFFHVVYNKQSVDKIGLPFKLTKEAFEFLKRNYKWLEFDDKKKIYRKITKNKFVFHHRSMDGTISIAPYNADLQYSSEIVIDEKKIDSIILPHILHKNRDTQKNIANLLVVKKDKKKYGLKKGDFYTKTAEYNNDYLVFKVGDPDLKKKQLSKTFFKHVKIQNPDKKQAAVSQKSKKTMPSKSQFSAFSHSSEVRLENRTF